MKITMQPIHPVLHEFVDAIFTLHRDAHDKSIFYQTALPSYGCHLSFEFDTDFLVKKGDSKKFIPVHSSTVIPPQLLKTEIKGRRIRAIMIKFKSSGFFRLFKMPVTEFNNRCFNARDVFNGDFATFYQQMMESELMDNKLKILEDFLLKKANQSKPLISLDFAVEELTQNLGNLPIIELASTACMSMRQLQRKFLERFGLSPKHYSKFIRYTKAHQMKISSPHITWGEISFRCGYFDQMHLIHDFKSITGLTPYELIVHPSDLNIFSDNDMSPHSSEF